ncbi:MAG TPA: ATPase, T2SS/T4P/T4SS family [Oligoflexia bacterium]|nr:ATPase, T2SS/T4P/T4SS family [Oligoflexia bacterium]HMP27483.1 ATPase, T2SS/T4P/T4SS family [Oligoflexia bacterium]
MSDSKDNSKNNEDLSRLFSTRATQHRGISRSLIESEPKNPQVENITEAEVAKTETPKKSQELIDTPRQPRPTLTGSSNTTSTIANTVIGTSHALGKQQTRSQLSALAATILREAKRELGSDYQLQQGANATNTIAEKNIVEAVERVIRKRGDTVDDIERANIIITLQRDLMGWGPLQPLIEDRQITDIHVYDYQTVVLQKGKSCETTGVHWPNAQAYQAFIDRLLMRLGKSLSTQQHTVDASFPNGIRICAIHESVCGVRGPLLSIRIPRMLENNIETLVAYQLAPPLIIDYLAALTRSAQVTMIIAGETGTGKTTLLRCLGTQFGLDESIVAVEDTPELNFPHPYFRSLIARSANIEGVGEVTLQEHIKATLRMTPNRVILGEMRSPLAAEAFLESAQTGHVGMSTIHARSARETLVRLEALLGRAQKSVSIDIIRQQISLAVDSIVWLHREKGSGKPRIGEVIEVGHFVEGVIQIKPIFTQMKRGANPIWQINSWSSNFDDFLLESGVDLKQGGREIGFNTPYSGSDSGLGGRGGWRE